MEEDGYRERRTLGKGRREGRREKRGIKREGVRERKDGRIGIVRGS